MKLTRRAILRGAFQGSVFSVALPFLDCLLDSKGQALAATGARIPTRFNTFFFGLGLTDALYIPKTSGTEWETPPLLKVLEPFKKRMNLFTDLHVALDGKPNAQHFTGLAAITTGVSPARGGLFETKTMDLTIADKIGQGSRYKTVGIACSGNKSETYSSLGGANAIPPEVSPIGLYTRLFGPGFQDPSKGDWKPDPQLLLRRSVLSVVAENRQDMMAGLGASDRARMDQFFTSVREAEQQIQAQLKRPDIIAKVELPQPPEDMQINKSVTQLEKVIPLMSKLAAIGIAMDQTRVVNMTFSEAGSTVYLPGGSLPFHQATHEEPIHPTLGYQVEVAEFQKHSMEFFAMMLKELDAIPEGDGTLLDHSLTMAYSDTSFAKIHALDGLPIITVGGASGKIKTGYHIAGGGRPVTRVGLTIQKAYGLAVDTFGVQSLETKNPYTELLA